MLFLRVGRNRYCGQIAEIGAAKAHHTHIIWDAHLSVSQLFNQPVSNLVITADNRSDTFELPVKEIRQEASVLFFL